MLLNHFTKLVSWQFLTVCFILTLTACKDDLDLIGEHREVPIVYCTFSNFDNEIYARVEKAFADNDISPLIIAQNPDSLYFPEVEVTIGIEGEPNHTVMEKVDAAQLGLPREDGLFPTAPNYVYRANRADIQIKNGAKYVLTVKTPKNEFKSYTTLLDTLTNLTQPRNITPVGWIPSSNENINNGPIISYNVSPKATKDSRPVIFNTFIRFNYSERDLNVSPIFQTKSILVPSLKNVVPVSDQYRILWNQVYKYLGENLEFGPNIERQFINFDIVLVYAGNEFAAYNEALAANSGITGSSDFPIYSNIEGGFGIFASRNRQEFKNFYFEPRALDSLKNSRFTKHLGFL